jgi:serine/threonine protein kinase
MGGSQTMTDSRPHNTEPSMVGRVLGNYRIVAELSTGGMGTVYRAEHELLGRTAAVKLLRPELTANPELVQRFFNEAKAATAIRHPGIIEVFDFGHAEDGRAYLIMEFLDGDSLAKRLADRGRLSEQEAAQITRGIASALTAAHKRGIVHRDLKPDNIFLVPDPDLPSGERPKVLDFGIAKLADPVPSSVRHTATGVLMGTPLYMAPEQARAAAEIDHRADLYSLGCILYELLVGDPPFVAQGAGEIIALQLFGQPTAPSARLSTISGEMERIVMRLLEKEPADRFQSAAELNDVLAAQLGSFSRSMSASVTAADSRPHITLSRAGVTPRTTSDVGRVSTSGDRALVSAFEKTVAPIDLEPPRRNLLPLIAGGFTLAIAGVVTALVLTRGHAARDVAKTHVDETTKVTAPPVQNVTQPATEKPEPRVETKPPPEPKIDPKIDRKIGPKIDPKPESKIEPEPPIETKLEPPIDLKPLKPHVVVKVPHTRTVPDPKKAHTDKGSPIEVNLDSKEP